MYNCGWTDYQSMHEAAIEVVRAACDLTGLYRIHRQLTNYSYNELVTNDLRSDDALTFGESRHPSLLKRRLCITFTLSIEAATSGLLWLLQK